MTGNDGVAVTPDLATHRNTSTVTADKLCNNYETDYNRNSEMPNYMCVDIPKDNIISWLVETILLQSMVHVSILQM